MNTIIPHIIDPALAYLPPQMTSDPARAMLVAIGLQESALKYRVQHNGGPARGLWQFERDGGVLGVLRHPSTREHAVNLCWRLGYPGTIAAVYHHLDVDDRLAAGFARLLLWTLPWALPGRDEVEEGWKQYTEAWRPGKPHRERWDENFKAGWTAVEDAQ